MYLSVAIGMKQDPIVGGLPPSVYPPHQVVVVPAGETGDLLLADRTDSFLFFPEGNPLVFPLEVLRHLDTEAFFKVRFPGWVVGIGRSFDFPVALDGDVCWVQ